MVCSVLELCVTTGDVTGTVVVCPALVVSVDIDVPGLPVV